jgi:hypothetical protein
MLTLHNLVAVGVFEGAKSISTFNTTILSILKLQFSTCGGLKKTLASLDPFCLCFIPHALDLWQGRRRPLPFPKLQNNNKSLSLQKNLRKFQQFQSKHLQEITRLSLLRIGSSTSLQGFGRHRNQWHSGLTGIGSCSSKVDSPTLFVVRASSPFSLKKKKTETSFLEASPISWAQGGFTSIVGPMIFSRKMTFLKRSVSGSDCLTSRRYIDRAEPKEGLQSCARICVEVDLEKGLPEAINLMLDNWSYVQKVDYGQLPFKCKACHEYKHFAKNCPKATPEANTAEQEENGNNPREKGRRENEEHRKVKARLNPHPRESPPAQNHRPLAIPNPPIR